MGKLSIVFEGEDIIGTGFYGSSENVRPPTVDIYSLVEVMFHYKRLHHVFFPLFSVTD
jgi:hypothetical protein